MINPKFHLQAPKEAKEADFPILMLFSVNGKRLQYYTGIRAPIQYHIKGGKYPFNNKWQQGPAAKIKLDDLLRHAYSIESDFIKKGTEQSVETFKVALDERFKGRITQVVKKVTLDDVIQEYLIFIKRRLTESSFKNTQTPLNLLRSFLGDRVNKITVSQIDGEILLQFKEFVTDGRMNNTVVKTMQKIRSFLHYCLKKKYIKEMPDIEVGSPNNITVIHLTHDQVMKIAYTPMPSLTLERVKDFFLFGCFTGMRYGDIAGLEKNNVFAGTDPHVKFFNQKNGSTQTITVPLVPVSLGILNKYKDIDGKYALKSISNQKTNDFLKKVGEIAGVDDKVVIAEKSGIGKISKKEYKLYELLTAHTSRKSFITIAMTLEMTEAAIKSITGHQKDSRAFHKYYDVVDSVKFSQMNKAFNN